MSSKERFYADITAYHPGVTGSLIWVTVRFPDQTNLMFNVDCGIFQDRDNQDLNESLPMNPQKLAFTLVTHVHVDHVGRLPLLVKRQFGGNKIYATQDTCTLMRPALEDTYHVLKNGAKKKNKKVLYQEDDVERTLELREPCKYQEPIQVHEHIKVTFFKNAHLVGASIILVQISYPEFQDINLLFTGDYAKDNVFLDHETLPEWVLKLPLTVIQESTYGTTESSDKTECFNKNVADAAEANKTILIPVLALGRAQEVLYRLKQMQDEGTLNPAIPIYLDGALAQRYTRLYHTGKLHIKEDMRDFLPKNFKNINRNTRYQVMYGKDAKIILTTSGMGSFGPAQVYIPKYIPRKDVLIHFTCYTAEETFGAKLKNTAKRQLVEIAGLVLEKLATVEYTTEFSSHAKADEMIEFLNQFEHLNLVLVNHGDSVTKEAFAQRIFEQVKPKQVGILGEHLFRVNAFKLVKTIPAKCR